VDVDLRVKCDPRADGREAQPGDLIEFWVRWSCPDLAVRMVKITNVGVAGDVTFTVDCASWEEVVALGESLGLTLPPQPSCPVR